MFATPRDASSVRAKTLRLTPEFEVGLVLLKRVLGMPINKMVNEAVGEYIQKRSAEVESNLTGVLEQLKAYRRADPNFQYDLDQFVAAEARFGAQDPVEGVVYQVTPPVAAAKKPKAGPALTMVREILRG